MITTWSYARKTSLKTPLEARLERTLSAKVARKRTNIWESIGFLHANRELAEKEMSGGGRNHKKITVALQRILLNTSKEVKDS